MKIEVLVSNWTAEEQTFGGGVHEIAKPTKKFLALAAAAEAAGSIQVTASKDERKAMSGHVQADSESVAARTAAQRSGAWYEGNLAQFEADVDAGIRESFGDHGSYVEDRIGVTDG